MLISDELVLYLYNSANKKEFSSSAEISKVLELADHELKRGTSIGRLVFLCCAGFPKKEVLEKLIRMAKRTKSEREIVKSVFDYENQYGHTCLVGLFDLAKEYQIENNGQHPSGPMLRDIEESFAYLIDMAKKSSFDLKKVLNRAAEDGTTLFFRASMYSEEIVHYLLQEDVQINSITDLFTTPSFRVRLKHEF